MSRRFQVMEPVVQVALEQWFSVLTPPTNRRFALAKLKFETQDQGLGRSHNRWNYLKSETEKQQTIMLDILIPRPNMFQINSCHHLR